MADQRPGSISPRVGTGEDGTQAWQWVGDGRIEKVSLPRPKPGPGQVLVRIRAIGVCGTDLNIVSGLLQFVPPPNALGHELAGVVFDVGRNVTRIKSGDRCCIDPLITCGVCDWCQTGRRQHCATGCELGITTAGGWQEYLVVPDANCYVLPDQVTFAEATQAEPLHVVLGGLDRLRIRPAEAALVIGDGPTGLYFARLLHASGCRPVTLAGLQPKRLDLARRWGIERAVNVGSEDLAQVIGPQGPPIVVEAVGDASSVQQAVSLVAPGGRVLLFGLPGEQLIGLELMRVVLDEITLIGGSNAPTVWPRVVTLLDNDTAHVKEMITHVFSFDDLPASLRFVRNRPADVIKAVVNV